MKRRSILIAIAAIPLAANRHVMAQGRDEHRDNGQGHSSMPRRPSGGGPARGREPYRQQAPSPSREGPGPQYRPQLRNEPGRDDRDQGQYRNFRRGTRLPAPYRQSEYVVDDWRSHNLRAPPRGYHWVQHGGDYLLVAIATGLILDILLNH